MNGYAKDTGDLGDILLDDTSGDSAGGEPCSFSLGDVGIPEAFGTEDNTVPAPALTPSANDVFNIDNFSGSDDDDGGVARQHLSVGSGMAAADGAGAVAAPGSVATGSGDTATRRPPPRAVNASRKLPPGEAQEEDSESHPSSSFSDDGTDEHSVHSSDGNEIDDNGSIRSVIGSVDGEGGSEMSDSEYVPSTLDDTDGHSSPSSPSADDMSCSSTEGKHSVISFQAEVPTFDRPTGMMLAKPEGDDPETDFVPCKIRQKYEINVDGEPSEAFEVIFMDGERAEYSREEVLLYRENYVLHEGNRGCEEFFFKV